MHGSRQAMKRFEHLFLAMVFAVSALVSLLAAEPGITMTGTVMDASSGRPLPARVYIRSTDGTWFFPKSASPDGSAVQYRRQVGTASVEMHTTLSAHPFTLELPPGRFVFSAEHGKEFLPAEQVVEVGKNPAHVELRLKRWINMAARGWFSGDTHSHRPLNEMTNALLAEDLNLAFPLSHWVTVAEASPKTANQVRAAVPRSEVLSLDATHLLYPLNTEYEIFTTGGKAHTLGAFLVIGHKTPFEQGVPPVAQVLAQARREGALIDLEKHSWPWSVAMAAVLKVDLFELANNHVWRTPFGFPQWTLPAAGKYMNLEMDAHGFTEWGWIDFGFQTYYALLNCGFPIRPTGGTAAGVHPVPLGFGRVYVRQPDGFAYDKWMAGLKAGHSFVTTGPMLFMQVNGTQPGDTLRLTPETKTVQLSGSVESASPLERIEIIVNGRVVKNVALSNQKTPGGAFLNLLAEPVPIERSGWVAVRAFEENQGRRNRFAHSSPVIIEVPGRPLRLRREEIDYLLGRVEEEIARNRGVLSPAALDEYQQALKIYQAIAEDVRL